MVSVGEVRRVLLEFVLALERRRGHGIATATLTARPCGEFGRMGSS